MLYVRELSDRSGQTNIPGGQLQRNSYTKKDNVIQRRQVHHHLAYRSKIFYKCVEDIPPNTLKKVKYDNAREGIIRADWLTKIVDRV